MNHNEEGFTLVEVLMAMAILAIVISLVSVSFVFVSGRMSAWNEQISFYNDFQILSDQLHNDLFRAEAISYTDSTLLVNFEEKQNRGYSWNNGNLKINNSSIFLPQDSVNISIMERVEDEQNVVNYTLFFRREARSMVDSATIKIRKPILWESVNIER
tara:strand:- start:10097 stop:10570 length:474 start_codon:yes stop_codon:yes gene_type:complete